MENLLLTGASGYIGNAILRRLQQDANFLPIAAVRNENSPIANKAKKVVVGEISSNTDWSAALADTDVVVHAAGRAHVLKREPVASATEFQRVNAEGSLNLARQAVKYGVRRFVFISSIGVVGASSERPLNEQQEPHPDNPYALSKLEAEQGLREISMQSDMEVVIIRPPLVYGAGAPGNFARLKRLLSCGLPLPLAAVDNLRSFVALENLVDFVVTCLRHPAAANQAFHVSDGVDLSTPEFLRLMSTAMGCHERLFWFPVGILKLLAGLLGKRREIESLCDSLQVDISKAHLLLDWEPLFEPSAAMRAALQDNASGVEKQTG